MDYSEKASALVDKCMEFAGTTYAQAASRIVKNDKPLSRQSFFKMVKSGSIRLSVFLAFLDAYGLELSISKAVEESGPVEEKTGEKSE